MLFGRAPLDAPLSGRTARFNMAAPFVSGTGRGEQSPNRHYHTYAYFCRNRRVRDSDASDIAKLSCVSVFVRAVCVIICA